MTNNNEMMEYIKKLEERIEQLEFRQGLLFESTKTNRILFEYNITQSQYRAIMDLMDKYRAMISKGEEVNHGTFETQVYEIVPEHEGDYHFVEFIAQAFMEDGRWDEVFPALYGDMPKYGGGGFSL